MPRQEDTVPGDTLVSWCQLRTLVVCWGGGTSPSDRQDPQETASGPPLSPRGQGRRKPSQLSLLVVKDVLPGMGHHRDPGSQGLSPALLVTSSHHGIWQKLPETGQDAQSPHLPRDPGPHLHPGALEKVWPPGEGRRWHRPVAAATGGKAEGSGMGQTRACAHPPAPKQPDSFTPKMVGRCLMHQEPK